MPRRAAVSKLIPEKPTAIARLYNAHRRIKSGRIQIATPGIKSRANKDDEGESWRKLVSQDVVDFIEKAKLLPHERRICLINPNRYFSRPSNVPPELRKQVYFPQFKISLMRTQHLPPKYAAFNVPLWFNKLDMKSYLKSVYNVDVIHVRSTVVQQKVKRRDTKDPYSQGRLYRPQSKKKMTVELVEPFVWPEAIEDLSAWEKDTYYAGMQASVDANRDMAAVAPNKPNEKHRKSIAQQAKELLEGKVIWRPTWESIPADARALQQSKPRKVGNLLDQAKTVKETTQALR